MSNEHVYGFKCLSMHFMSAIEVYAYLLTGTFLKKKTHFPGRSFFFENHFILSIYVLID